MRVTNRRLQDRGPEIDLTPMYPELCLVPEQDYLFVARLKLDMGDGTMNNTETSCLANNTHCPELEMKFRHVDSHERGYRKARLQQHEAPKYGEYFYFTQTITFSETEITPDNAYFTMLIHGVNTGVNITIDSFDLFLPSQSSYHNPNALCKELVFNGNAEGNGFNPYPMLETEYHERLKVIRDEEDGNMFWRLENRRNYHSSIR